MGMPTVRQGDSLHEARAMGASPHMPATDSDRRKSRHSIRLWWGFGSSFRRDESGGTALEYCFIAFLISIAAITATTQIGEKTKLNTESVLIGFSR
jgi:Flp pilus assembly pilin Flp